LLRRALEALLVAFTHSRTSIALGRYNGRGYGSCLSDPYTMAAQTEAPPAVDEPFSLGRKLPSTTERNGLELSGFDSSAGVSEIVRPMEE
jgi:hypothetical protein